MSTVMHLCQLTRVKLIYYISILAVLSPIFLQFKIITTVNWPEIQLAVQSAIENHNELEEDPFRVRIEVQGSSTSSFP